MHATRATFPFTPIMAWSVFSWPVGMCYGEVMEFIAKNQRVVHKNSDTCIAQEYPSRQADINGAVIELTGRYPAVGRVTNLKCKELVYILQGSGKLVTDDRVIAFHEGDMVIIEPGEKYYWDAHCTQLVSTTPAWYPEQHKVVE